MGFFSGSSNSDSNDSSSSDELYAAAKKSRNSTIIIFLVIIVAYVLYSSFGTQIFGTETTTGKSIMDSSKCPYLTEFVFGLSDYTCKSEDTTALSEDIQEQLANFYTSTGVQLVIYDKTNDEAMTEAELQAFADSFYADGLFDEAYSAGSSGTTVPDDAYDEGHLLLVFQPAGENVNVAFHVGEDAKSIFDDAAIQVFKNDINKAYSSKTGEDVLTNAIKSANSDIMGRSKASVYIIIILIAALVIYMVFAAFKVKKSRASAGSNNLQ